MKKLIFILPILAVLLSAGCQNHREDSTQNQAYIDKDLQSHIGTASQDSSMQKQKPSISKSLGISVDDDTITIDTKQTREFFKGFATKIKDGFKNIEKSLRKDQIESKSDTGITITKTTMHIDLNKTKSFMEQWIKSMRGVVNEIDKTMEEIEQSLPEGKQ